jgi:hypothetical protein
LVDDGRTLYVSDFNNNIIHAITYNAAWHTSSYKKDGGWSLELIDSNNPCGETGNWTSSLDVKGGTPGATNSVVQSNPDILSPKLIRAFIYNRISADTVKVYFNEIINYSEIKTNAFFIDNNVGNPIEVIPVAPLFNSVLLVFNQAFGKIHYIN